MPYQKKGNWADAPKRSRSFSAKWPGTCPRCNQPWAKGTPLVYENNVVVHETCPSVTNPLSLLKPNARMSDVNVPVPIAKEEGQDVIHEIETKLFVPSEYQLAAFEWATHGEGHAVMKAVAGSGKTTTIVKMLDILPKDIRILFVAFNKNIVRALNEKVQQAGYTNITVVTLNSSGFSVCRKYEGFQEVNQFKVLDILTDMGYKISRTEIKDPEKRKTNRIFRSAMNKLVEMVKSTLCDYNDPNAVLELINRFHIEIDEQMEQEIIEKLPEVMTLNNGNLEFVDFNDQCYLPVVNPYFANKFEKYDFILCDEFQDFNRCNIEYVLKCLAPAGRIIAVGDHHQSLYGFRGADPRAIPDAIERLQATVLPLSVSYRCPRSHITRMREIRPEIDIQPAPNAVEGVLGELEYKEMMAKVKEGDMVICRTNAPLVKPAFAVIRSGKKAIIRGKDIGKELVAFIERFNTDELGRLEILMQEYTQHEIERWLEKNKEMMAEQAKEKYDTIIQVMQEVKTVNELVLKIQTLFSDDNIGVVFSSVHRAKGLEAEVIFLYRPELMPHPRAKSDDEVEQEWNCVYVAGTRSLNELYIVSGEE